MAYQQGYSPQPAQQYPGYQPRQQSQQQPYYQEGGGGGGGYYAQQPQPPPQQQGGGYYSQSPAPPPHNYQQQQGYTPSYGRAPEPHSGGGQPAPPHRRPAPDCHRSTNALSTSSAGGGDGRRNNNRPPFWYRAPQGGRGEVKGFQGRSEWQVSLMSACCEQPLSCFLGYLFPWCCVFLQRRKLLFENYDNYECCAGMWGSSLTKKCNGCTKGNEKVCMCLESVFCLGCAIHGNRFMVMQHYNLQNDCCDVVIMWLSCICSIIACLLGDENLENLADFIYYVVIGCMLAQHENQMQVQGYPIGQLGVME